MSGGSSSKKNKSSEATTTSSSLFSSGGGGTLKSDKLIRERRQHTPVDEPPRSRLQSESRMEASMFVEPQVRTGKCYVVDGVIGTRAKRVSWTNHQIQLLSRSVFKCRLLGWNGHTKQDVYFLATPSKHSFICHNSKSTVCRPCA